jgi:pimeloyl-ACP methyl ester carboxylesterase
VAASTPLVLLHPYPTDATFWNRFRAALGDNRPVMAPDAPGFGTAPLHPGWSIASAADGVAELIAHLAPDGRADVMGLSMGGYTALALAARHPQRVAGLVLAGTRADADDDATRHARDDAIAALASGGRERYLSGLMGRLMAPSATADVRDEVAACAARQPSEALADALRALAGRPDRRAELAGVTIPTLVVVGTEDVVTPPAAAQELAAGIGGARLVEVPGAGHLSALERPGPVAALVAGFLDSRSEPHKVRAYRGGFDRTLGA